MKSRMRESRMSGSERGALCEGCVYSTQKNQYDNEYSMEIGEMEKVDAERVIACATADFNEFLGDAYNCLVE